jgi:hypothetical protein
MARPTKKADPALIEGLAAKGCSDEEIAIHAEVSARTLKRRFAEPIKRGQAKLRFLLRSKQVELATAGNVVMLIWLGKNLLGQTDKIVHAGSAEEPVRVETSTARDDLKSTAKSDPEYAKHIQAARARRDALARA